MSKLKNAPLVEVVFEIKWGKTIQDGRELRIEFSQEELLMPGKFQIHAEEARYEYLEVVQNLSPIPHLVKYRYREKPNSYPLYQLGGGVFTLNQADIGGFEYDWDIFKEDAKKGIELFEKSYPYPIKDLPLIDIQLLYRDAVTAENDQSIFDFISENMNVGNFTLPSVLNGNDYTDSSSGSITFQIQSKNPSAQVICKINQGVSQGKRAFIIDSIVISKANVFAEITSKSLLDWCLSAHGHQSTVFNAIFTDKQMDLFR